jgi:hypothetical protein
MLAYFSTDKKSCTLAVGQEMVVLLASIGDGLQLKGRQLALFDGGLGQVEVVPDFRGLNAGHTSSLHDWIRVRLANLESNNCRPCTYAWTNLSKQDETWAEFSTLDVNVLKLENTAQTTLRLSPDSFRSP